MLLLCLCIICTGLRENTSLNPYNQEEKYKTYRNSRYSFCAEYPSTFLFPQTPPENGDGLRFKSKDGSCTMVASGIHLLEDELVGKTKKQLLREAYQDLLEEKSFYNREVEFTYQRLGSDFFVLSGYVEGNIFYFKRYLRANVFKGLYVEYPPAEKERFDGIISHITQTFPDCIFKFTE